MDQSEIVELIRQMQERRGRSTAFTKESGLRDIGFESIDFAELAVRLEDGTNKRLNFSALEFRQIQTVADVAGFFAEALTRSI
jgi:acyl carrier protein